MCLWGRDKIVALKLIFLDVNCKAQPTILKVNKWDYIILSRLCVGKVIIILIRAYKTFQIVSHHFTLRTSNKLNTEENFLDLRQAIYTIFSVNTVILWNAALHIWSKTKPIFVTCTQHTMEEVPSEQKGKMFSNGHE